MPCASASSVALRPVPPRDVLFVQCPGPLPAGSSHAKESHTAGGSGPATPIRAAVSPRAPVHGVPWGVLSIWGCQLWDVSPGTSRACWTSWNSTTRTPRIKPRWDSESGGDSVSLSPVPGCHLLPDPRWCHPGSPRGATGAGSGFSRRPRSWGIPAWIAAVPGPGVPSAVPVPGAGSPTRW